MSTGRLIICHIPIYFLALAGLGALILLLSLPRRDSSTVSIPDGTINYTSLSDSLTMGELRGRLELARRSCFREIKEVVSRKDMPRQIAIWIHISPDKTEPNTVVYLDYIYQCQECSRNDIFDICRLNLNYDRDGGVFLTKGLFWRDMVKLEDYLIPSSHRTGME